MSQARRLACLLLLNLGMIAGLVVVGVTAGSLAVLAAGGDFAVDSLAIMLGLVAVHMRDHSARPQAPTYVALINGVVLLGITVAVLIGAVHRLLTTTPEVHGLPVLVISLITAVVMLVGVIILGRSAGAEDLHMRSVLLDTMADGASALGVAVVGGIIYVKHGWYWLDAAAALAIGSVIGFVALRLLGNVTRALR